ncbi:hypothetical protein [Arthrobacter sp. CJ23]|uniref:hypothetical protein n=1 Tax=Arthrobacter sp. CJ23 TaxID=2972479 RepID=UPI00215D333B|nr:hypothetical protein [Arthrobacter sp. CJ23]UVJ37985.1 hypothetical protein NVV90_11980 [Arthrobacter sp. CJ23]
MSFTLTTETNGNTVDHKVDIKMADLARYDIVRNRHGFPAQENGQFLFMVLVSYCSLVRTGAIADTVKPEDFIDTVLNIEPEAEEEAEPSKSKSS